MSGKEFNERYYVLLYKSVIFYLNHLDSEVDTHNFTNCVVDGRSLMSNLYKELRVSETRP